ncbi:MAG: acyl-CoA dehydrogenase family protein [Elusimicrobiota bacterium]
MNNYNFTEEQLMIKDLARQIAQDKVKPVRAELDEKREFPEEIMKTLADSDLFAIFVPEEYGGLGGGALELCIVTEELSKVCAGVAVSYAASALGAYPIMLYGSEEQKKKYLPQIASGEKLAAFGLTEPNAGSDASGIETTAEKDGDDYILNGNKVFITNGGVADIYTVVAMTDKSRGPRGASALIVEKGTDGFDFGKEEDKMGIRASATRELVFDECRVPVENLLKREGLGFIVAMKTFDKSRPGIGAQAVGIAQGAIDEAVKYATQRIQFGRPISSFQANRHKIAELSTKTEAARNLVYRAARMVDSGKKDVSKISAMSKLFASDVAMEVTTEAVQILGGYGYMKEYPLEKYMRDAKITQIYEGTNEIQKGIIGQEVIKESKSKA